MARASVFTVRICRRCQLAQVQGNGPLGDRQWHPTEPFPGGPWEVARYAAATAANYLRLMGR